MFQGGLNDGVGNYWDKPKPVSKSKSEVIDSGALCELENSLSGLIQIFNHLQSQHREPLNLRFKTEQDGRNQSGKVVEHQIYEIYK